MGWLSHIKAILWTAVFIGIGSTVSAYYTSEESTRQYSVGISDVSLEYRTSGRVYIANYDHGYRRLEVCADTFSTYEAEALCRTQGFSYSSYSRTTPRDRHHTVTTQCRSYSLRFCDVRTNDYCSQVVYLSCRESTTPWYRYSTRSSMTTEYETRETRDITQKHFTVGYSDLSMEYGSYGRVYVSHYNYGYNNYEVCSSGFSYTEGEAMCRAKGYTLNYFSSAYPRNSHQTVSAHCSPYMYDFYKYCDIRTLGYCPRVVQLYCYESTTTSLPWWERVTTEDYQTTRFDIASSNNTRVRLVGSEYPDRGTIEVLHNGRWGTICDDAFDRTDGDVICRMLGYSSSIATYDGAQFGAPQGNWTIWLDEVNCRGYESDISQCGSRGWGTHDCSHSEDAGVQCNSRLTTTVPYGQTDVRLVGSEYPDRGRIEVLHNGEWGTVCDDEFGKADGDVICRMLGYNFARNHQCCAYYGEGSGVIFLDDVRCQGNENDIADCRSRGWGVHDCHHTEDVSVHCGYTDVRLVGSVYSDRGTVEILHNGRWGTICDDNFNIESGNVICRMLGFEYARAWYGGAHYGQGNGSIWLDGIRCGGYESDIAECRSNGWGVHDCSHGEDSGVLCGSFLYTTSTKTYRTTTTPYRTTTTPYRTKTTPYRTTTILIPYRTTTTPYRTTTTPYRTTTTPYRTTTTPYRTTTTPYKTTYNPCYSYPCRHGGTCYHNYGYPGYHCTCPSGYSGQHCESYQGFSAESSITVGCNQNGWNIGIYLPPLYSRYSDFNSGDIYLGQDSCTGYVDGNYLRFRLDYTTCGTQTSTTGENVVHTNEIVYALHDPNHHFIVREYRLKVPVDCYLPRNEETNGHFYHHDNTLPPAHHVTGATHHTVHLQFYTDSSFMYTKPLYGSKVGDRVYVKATTDVRDYSLKMRLSDCFTTPTSSAYSSMKYFIIKNGCVIDPNSRILSQSTHETRFYFQDFEYSTNRDSLYLHCNATFCKSNDYSAACEQTCHHKRLGGGNLVNEGPLDTVYVNDAVRLTGADSSKSGSKFLTGNSALIAAISLVFSVIILAMIISIIIGKIKIARRKRKEVVKDI